MNRFFTVIATFSLSAAVVAQSPNKDTIKLGGELATSKGCVACHNADGNSTNPIYPSLAGQHAAYLLKQLKEFKPGADGQPSKRANAVMLGFASTLSDEEAVALSAWYASKTLKPSQSTDVKLAKLGERIYRGGIAEKAVPACAACHGATGAGMPSQYPSLANQQAEYTIAQMKQFRDGERNNSPEMSAIAAKLLDKEIIALADYLAGLRRAN